MPRTYGEVCPSCFSDIFCLGGDTDKVLIDCGSGHGVLVKAAVERYGCTYAIGIEKYKEPAEVAAKMFTSSARDLQAKMRFLFEDMNDTNIFQQLQGLTFATVIFFCNNLAFREGTVHRCYIDSSCSLIVLQNLKGSLASSEAFSKRVHCLTCTSQLSFTSGQLTHVTTVAFILPFCLHFLDLLQSVSVNVHIVVLCNQVRCALMPCVMHCITC